MLEREYIAFISYRHKPLDISIAKRVHRLIEHYHIPKDLRKGDASRLGYVFRDRDELPLSSDLTSDIKSALDRSSFLIVICTPDTPKSPWVCLEIEYFLEHHDRSHVLTVLADGVTEDAFPKQLTHVYETDGVTLNRIVEPLAANIVSPLRIKRNHLLREEFLRLVAAILECPYDMLKQRQKKYVQQRVSLAAALVTVTALCFATLMIRKNGEILAKNQELQERNEEIQKKNRAIQAQQDEIERKNEEIQDQLNQSLRNESHALSLISDQLLEQGDRFGAIENALNALPSEGQNRPELVEAELALCNALYAYLDVEMRAACQVKQDTEIEEIAVDQSGSHVATLDQYDWLRCFDGYTGELLWKKKVGDRIDYLDCITIIEQGILCSYYDGKNEKILLFSLKDGTILNELNFDDEVGGNETISVSDIQEEMVVWNVLPLESAFSPGSPLRLDHGKVHWGVFYRTSDFKEISTIDVSEELVFSSYDCWSTDGATYACILRDEEKDVFYLYVFDVNTGELLYRTQLDTNKGYLRTDMVFLPDNDLMVLQHNFNTQYLYRLDGETGDIEYRQVLTETDWRNAPCTLLFNDSKLICLCGRSAYTFELETGKQLDYQILSSDHKFCYWMDEKREKYVVVQNNGEAVVVDPNSYNSYWTEDKDETYYQFGTSVLEVYGSRKEVDYICVLPEYEKHHALIYRLLGDMQKDILSVPETYYNPYLFQSEDKVIYLQDIYTELKTLIVYDASSMDEIGSYNFRNNGSMYFKGFSREGTKLIFSDGSFDLESGVWMPFGDNGWDENTYDFKWHLKEACIQESGKPTILVNFRRKAQDAFGVLYWSEDGGDVKESICPYEGYGYQFYDAVGGSGIIGIALQDGTNPIKAKGYAVYFREKDTWSYLPNPCKTESFPTICVGNQNPWLAFCDDGLLRIVNAETGEAVRTFPLDVEAASVSEMQFLLNDKILLMIQDNNRLCIFDTDDGTVKALLDLESDRYQDCYLSIQLDEAEGNLYIGERSGKIEGFCIDLSTWKVRRKIPGLMGFVSKSHQIIKRENDQECVSYPAYTLKDLVEKGRNLLDK